MYFSTLWRLLLWKNSSWLLPREFYMPSSVYKAGSRFATSFSSPQIIVLLNDDQTSLDGSMAGIATKVFLHKHLDVHIIISTHRKFECATVIIFKVTKIHTSWLRCVWSPWSDCVLNTYADPGLEKYALSELGILSSPVSTL